ncbi:hypothetical protein ABT095_14285 [Kitasatospora sp. NPDC002227]|uniref:hypothetical protein n=1 Tax=Kitasatospora sp. NPDC002227 TaxID=3154773 RepID=UPI0033340FF1
MTTDQGHRPLNGGITPADVIAVRDFLHERAEALARAADFHSDAYRIPTALQFAIVALVDPLLAALDRHGDSEAVERDIAVHWNHLVTLAGPWEGQPGHDAARWREVEAASPPCA